MSLEPKSFSQPADPLKYLQYARQVLVDELPATHHLRQRVQAHSNGELLPEQPAGRPRALFHSLPPRKRGRDRHDPSQVLQRRHLMIMWNHKYHLQEDWDRAFDKMKENYKKLGLKERSYKESGDHKRGSADSADNKSEEGRESMAEQNTNRKRTRDDDTLAVGYTSSDARLAKKKRHRLDLGDRDSKVSRQGVETARKSVSPPINLHSSEEQRSVRRQRLRSASTQRLQNLSKSQVRTLKGVLNASSCSPAVNDATPPAPSPTVTEEVVRSSAMLMQRLTKLAWGQVGGDVDEFYAFIHDNPNTDRHKGWGRGEEARGEQQSVTAVANDDIAAHDQDRFSFMLTSDGSRIADADMHSRDGIVVRTRMQHVEWPVARRTRGAGRRKKQVVSDTARDQVQDIIR